MPQNVTLAAFIFGAILVLIAIIGGSFKLFGAEISRTAGKPLRIVSGAMGAILIVVGLLNPIARSSAPSSSGTVQNRSGITLPAPTAAPLPTGAFDDGPAPSSTVNISGVWRGILSVTYGQNIHTYPYYQMKLSQDGNLITGRIRIERPENKTDFAEYNISGGVLDNQGQALFQINETELVAYNNYMAFDDDAVAPKGFRLRYTISQGKEVLNGEWFDLRSSSYYPSRVVQFTKQP